MIFVEALLVFVIIALAWMLVMLAIFKKLNRARIKGVLLILLAFVGVAAVIFIVGHSLEWHETNEFCTSFWCHAMDGPYESYTQPKNNTMMEVHFEEDVPCAQCHSGPGLVGLGTSFLAVPNEMLHQYLLGYDENNFGGHVPAENCIKGCHEEEGVDWWFNAPMPKGQGYNESDGAWKTRVIYHPLTKNGTDLKELKKLETCLDCHDARDNSFGIAAEACHICHDIDEEELEHHGESTCDIATCHRNEQGEPVQPKLTGHNTVTDHCMECHSRNHPDDAFVPYVITNSKGKVFEVNSSFCKDCHEETYQEISGFSSKHFTENECGDCHLEHKTRPDCLTSSCHGGTEYRPIHNVTDPFDECSDCHEQGGHNPLEINFQAQITAGNTALVSKDFCNSCHQTEVYEKIVDKKLHEREEFTEDCLSCHDAHEVDIECIECHVPGGFGGLADEPDHVTIQPFDECMDCHTQGHFPKSLNFSFFEGEQGAIDDDFCIDCHTEPKGQLIDYGFSHESQDCSSCHETHDKEEVDCLSCHGQAIAPLPSHDIQNPYQDCLNCHESGHAPLNLSFPNPASFMVNNDFCSDVSCHGGSDGVYTIFKDYGGKHNSPSRDNDCQSCHIPHNTYDDELTVDFTCNNCHGTSPSNHARTYDSNEKCLACHNSPHDPVNRAPQPGFDLSQREYMINYYNFDTSNMTASFGWVNRGNHQVFTDCTECHSSAEEVKYPASAQALMNVTGTDCSGSCHEWIDSTTSGKPITLLNEPSNPFSAHLDNIFNNATVGGCAGSCHQSNPSLPDYSGDGHGTIANCLNSDCHGPGFDDLGPLHVEHGDMLSFSSLTCFEVCHKQKDFPDYGEPIDGGCYDCHKSGHNPKILSTSSCYVGPGCHESNKP
ncbi:MAG: hypothetical protein JSV09_01405 [Thermoplasmata archaeon]|nr:MAG: hypothetical protein JSV09_01405 [Thermoplasmata archaeon]